MDAGSKGMQRWKTLGNVGAAIGAALPVTEETLTIQVYGNNLSDKTDLEYLIYYIVQKKLPYQQSAGKYNFKLEIDAMGSYARIQVNRTSSPLNVTAEGVTNVLGTDLSKWLFGPQKNADLHNRFLDASVILTGDKFDLNRLHNKSFFADLQKDKTYGESMDGVFMKTYVKGQLNPDLIDLSPISARNGSDQMRGSFLEQIFVEGVRSNPTEYPIDPHQNTHEYYEKDNTFEQHLGDKNK